MEKDDYYTMLNNQKETDKEIIEFIKKSFFEVDPIGIMIGMNDFFIAYSAIGYNKLKAALYRYNRIENKFIKISKDFDMIYHYGLLFNESNYFIVSNYINIKISEKDYILYEYDETTDKCKKIINDPSYYNITSYVEKFLL